MDEKTKELLIKDIAGRVLTNTYVKCIWMSDPKTSFNHLIHVSDLVDIKFGAYKEYKPYLRPMHTMSDSEREQYEKLQKPVEKVIFLNKHHFDHSGLIDINLAIEAPKNIYKL